MVAYLSDSRRDTDSKLIPSAKGGVYWRQLGSSGPGVAAEYVLPDTPRRRSCHTHTWRRNSSPIHLLFSGYSRGTVRLIAVLMNNFASDMHSQPQRTIALPEQDGGDCTFLD